MRWLRQVARGVRKGSAPPVGTVERESLERFARQRADMVREQLECRDITDERVLTAMGRVPREEFVPEDLIGCAYDDRPQPIGYGQTVSQPYVVAYMIQEARVFPGARVLDVGTGSGYQAAVLAAMGAVVYGVEIVPELAARAARHPRLAGVCVQNRDGSHGWEEHAPFQAILVAAAAPVVPPALRRQLAVGGKLVIPVGGRDVQHVIVVTREPAGFREEVLLPVCFVPMTGGIRASASALGDERIEGE